MSPATSKPPAVMSQLNDLLASLVTGAVLVLYVELRARSRTRWTCDCDPIFRKLRNGRVRFTLDDLRNSQPPTAGRHSRHRSQEGRVPVPDLDHDSTIPDLPHHPGPPRHRRTSGIPDE